jgi:hypothetical protein
VLYLKDIYYPQTGETWWDFVTMSANPTHPQGVCLHAQTRVCWRGVAMSQQTKFANLPAECQRVIIRDLLPGLDDPPGEQQEVQHA